MTKFHPLGVILVLVVVAVWNVEPARTQINYQQLVELGTFDTADVTCFLRKIYKGQPSPITFSHVDSTNIQYAKAVATSKNSLGGVTMSLIGGALATPTASVQVQEAANKNFFVNDIEVTMRCVA